MKKQIWSVFLATISISLLAQTNLPVAAPPIATPAPAMTAPAATKAPAKKKVVPPKNSKPAAAREAMFTEKPLALVPGPAEVNAGNVNIRGQASFKGEVITRLQRGDTVTVLEQINLQKHKADEPAQWAEIAYPTNANVWVNAKYIDADTRTVKPAKLNLRAGPGENYSVVGLMERGARINEISSKGDWLEIEPPTNAHAFVAAIYLKQEALAVAAANAAPPAAAAPAPAPAPAETMPAPAPAPVPAAQPIVTQPTTVPAPTGTAALPATAMETPAPAAPAEQAPPSPPPPRVVTHEGVVRHVTSVIAPTAYELYDPSTGVSINYLYTTATNLDLSRYNGLRIIVTGQEGLAERWTETPVLTIQRILVVSTETNAAPKYQSVRPRTGHHY